MTEKKQDKKTKALKKEADKLAKQVDELSKENRAPQARQAAKGCLSQSCNFGDEGPEWLV